MTCLPLVTACLLLLVAPSCHGESLNFDPYFNEHTAFFSDPDEDHFGAFSGFEFRQNAPSGVQRTPTYRERMTPHAVSYGHQDSGDIPVYTDGSATPSQVTVSRLHRDYTAQLHRLASAAARPIASVRPPSHQRIPKFRSEPFASAASNQEEQRKPTSKPTDKPTTDAGQLILPLSKTVELQTGFVPIIKGSGQEQSRKASFASSVIKDIEPPILTAAPGSLTARPNLYKVSASVLSSTNKVAPAHLRQNGTSFSYFNEVRPRPRQASYSRGLNDRNDTVLAVSSSTSERVVSRVVGRPESILDLQQKELLRLQRPSEVTEESKLVAKKTLDLNCEGSQDLGWCELGDRYPRKYVNQVIDSCKDVIDRMHVEVPHSFEKLSDTSDFKSELDNSSSSSSFREAKERGSHDAWSWAAYFHQGSLCDAETGFLRPETAKDSSGKWNIIVQTDHIRQRVPIEMCRKTNGSCKKMLACGLKSQCLQKYNYHLLLSLNPALKQDCPFMKLYRFPSACVCHVE